MSVRESSEFYVDWHCRNMMMFLSKDVHNRLTLIMHIKLYDYLAQYKMHLVNLQIKSDQTERLLNKPYVNEVTLTEHNLY